jgi:diaminopimelate epimerase
MSAAIPIVKMSGAGNDFVVLDEAAWNAIPGDRHAWVRGVSRRGLSVGADGVLVVGPVAQGRVGVRFFNPDGGEAFCGNGSRCAARFAFARGMASTSMILATAAGDVPAEVDGASVRLTLEPPRDLGRRTLEAAGRDFDARLVLAGVPHLVIDVGDVSSFPLAEVGPALRRHPSLGPDGANVDVVAPAAGGRVFVRTWERGVENETLACGTGAVAVAFAARLDGAAETVVVIPRSGVPLVVTIPGDPLRPALARLDGDARFVFEGSLSPEGIAEPA